MKLHLEDLQSTTMKLAVFDLDGTVLDTLPNICESVNFAMHELGCPTRTQKEVRSFIGNSAIVLMEKALPFDKKHLTEQALDLHTQYYDNHLCEKTTIYKGVLQMLNSLKELGYELGIYSNKGHGFCKLITQHFFGDIFKYVRGTKDFTKRKPNPIGLLEIMSEAKVAPQNVVYVGDSDVDVKTAQNAGVNCISVLWGYQDKKQLKDAGGTLFAKKPMDVVKLAEKCQTTQINGIKYKKLNHKIGLTISGGGTRGFAGIGVIKAFEENGIKFDFVSGTSVGSFVASAYACGKSANEMIEFAKTVKKNDLIKGILPFGNDSANIENLAKRLIGDVEFKNLKIPFKCVAVDLYTGNEMVLEQGSVAKAVSASCAVPFVFKPVAMDDKSLVDGGLLNNMPSDVVRQMGAEFVVSVDLNHTRGKGTKKLNVFSQLVATWNIVTKSTVYVGQMNSDVIIEPMLEQYKSTAIGDVEAMIEEGYRATMEKMEEIKMFLNVK